MGFRKLGGGIAPPRTCRNRIMDQGRNKDADGSGSGSGSEQSVSMSAAQWASVIHPATEVPQHKMHDTSDKVPQAIEGTLAAVAASIIYSASGMSKWGLAEATLGLYKLHCRHVRERVIDTIDGALVTSMIEMQEIAHWVKWAKASYQEKTKTCAQDLEANLQKTWCN